MLFALAYTGGIDSTVLLYELARSQKNLVLLCCDYGQANWRETVRISYLHKDRLWRLHSKIVEVKHLTVALPEWELKTPLMREGYVPSKMSPKDFDYSVEERSYKDELIEGRNAFLFLHMLSWCVKNDVPVLYTGHQYEPKEWDNLDSFRHRTEDFGPAFIDRMNLLQEVGFSKRVRIEAPYLSQRLSKVDICVRGYNNRLNLRTDTYSCQYYPECGKCDNCANRERTFKTLGI